jgi:opacity protein-like surface antigen
MKNKLIYIVLTSMLLFVAAAGIADTEDKNYIGIQYGVGDYSEEGISKSYDPTAYMIRIGRYFSPNFSIEGRLGSGLDDDTQFLPEFGPGGLDVSLELDTIIGIYGVWHMNLSESSSIYGILGASDVEGTASVSGFPAAKDSNSESGYSYGIGADIGVSDNVALNIEYINYLDKSNVELSAIALGAVFSF